MEKLPGVKKAEKSEENYSIRRKDGGMSLRIPLSALAISISLIGICVIIDSMLLNK